MRRTVTTWDRYVNRESTRLIYNEPEVVLSKSISASYYDVFISHKGDDLAIAERTGDLLSSRGVSGYLDHWDPSVGGDSADLEVYLRDIIRDTPNILAVVTQNTPESWWVPFEIGVARETDSQVATYLPLDVSDVESIGRILLPTYLKTWPILVTEAELMTWADAFVKSRQSPLLNRTSYFEKSAPLPWLNILVAFNKVEFY